MPSHADRIEFNPPPQKGAVRSFGLALLAHGFLIAALTWGVSWKRTAENNSVEAELWSTTVMQAAPRAVETPPPPPPTTARVKETPPPPVLRQADIAVERERKQREEKRKEQDAQRELEKKRQAEKDAREKKAAAEKAALDKRKTDEARKREEQEDKLDAEKRRQAVMNRAQSMAGASGAADATGNAMQSSGPSAGYAGRLSALFKRNIVYPGADTIAGNPKAVVEVRVSPAGLIIGSRLVKSSGVPAWDDAVLRAVERAERIPSDNGRYVSVFPVEFGPKD